MTPGLTLALKPFVSNWWRLGFELSAAHIEIMLNHSRHPMPNRYLLRYAYRFFRLHATTHQ